MSNVKKSSAPESMGRTIIIIGTLFLIIVCAWPPLMALSAFNGTIEERILHISQNMIFFKLNFFMASLISLPLSVMIVIMAFFIKTKAETKILDILSVVFIIPYILLVTLAYTSQYALLPGLINSTKGTNSELVKMLVFENPNSIPFYTDQLGYVFFGFSALCVGYKLLKETGLLKWIGIFLWLSAIASILAFAGLVFSDGLKDLSVVGGILTIPIGILFVIYGKRLRNSNL